MKTLLAICLLFGATFSYAQESSDTFQIKDYKYRTPGFKALSFNFNFSGGFSRQGLVDTLKHSEKSIDLSPVRFDFYKVSSSDTRLHESNYSFSIGVSLSKTESTTDYRKQSRGLVQFGWKTSNQYFRKNNWFWELGNQFEVTGDKTKNEINTYYSNDDYLVIKDHPVLGIGKGRIEMVNDAQMALFILNDLEKEGLITNKGTKEQQNTFAKIITDINNQRVFDNRKKRIYELQRIDSFIKSSGLSATTDIRHFTTINDNWIYAYTPVRSHGNRWYFRLQPGGQYGRIYTNRGDSLWQDKIKIQYRALSIGSEAGYESRKAVSLQWQRNFSLVLAYRYEYYNHIYNSDKVEYYTNFADIEGSYSLGYFPNTRTYITAELTANFQKGNFLNDDEEGIRYSTGLNIQTSYFMGYRTRLIAGLGINYFSQEIQMGPFTKIYEQYGFHTNVYCSVSHNIF